MKKTLLLVLFYPCFVFSQNQINNWFFGDSLLMTFTDTGIIAKQVPSLNIKEASTSISDSSGNLLFYTDGKYVWNSVDEIMPNGCCLNIEYGWYASSITQGVIILPDPNVNEHYYIFCLNDDTLSYSIVDMNEDSGLGDVIVDKKNIVALSGKWLVEKMHAVKHGNGRDWWLMIHEGISSESDDSTNTFYKLLISPDGVSSAIDQQIGLKRTSLDRKNGQMIFSTAGDKLAMVSNNDLELFSFNRCNGELSQPLSIQISSGFQSYGCAFSPNGRRVYVSSEKSGGGIVYQYSIDVDDIAGSKTEIYRNEFNNYSLGQLQLGPNGKIYFTTTYYSLPNYIFSDINMNLSSIELPDLEGLSSDVDTFNTWLNNRRVNFGLPNFPNYSLEALTGSECDTIIEVAINDLLNENKITIYPNPTTGYLFFKGNFSSNELYNIIITDALGKKVFIKKDISLTQKLNISNLPQGIYTISIEQDNVIKFSDRIVITKEE